MEYDGFIRQCLVCDNSPVWCLVCRPQCGQTSSGLWIAGAAELVAATTFCRNTAGLWQYPPCSELWVENQRPVLRPLLLLPLVIIHVHHILSNYSGIRLWSTFTVFMYAQSSTRCSLDKTLLLLLATVQEKRHYRWQTVTVLYDTYAITYFWYMDL